MNAITDTKPHHKSIFAALASAQSTMGKAIKDSKNPAFKSSYADLASVMDACMDALNANGICVMQPTGEDDRGRYVQTIFAHTSGETVECKVPLIVGKNDMQGYGSAVTYARRYGLMCMAGIAPEDDDGNAAAKSPPRDEVIYRGPTAMDISCESLAGAGSLDQLSAIWKDLPRSVQGEPRVIKAKDDRKAALQNADVKDEIPY